MTESNASGASLTTGSCQALIGGGLGSEVYYEVVPTITGQIELSLDAERDFGVYVRSACGDTTSEVACADGEIGGRTEHLTFAVAAGERYFVVVDAFSPADVGPFTLSLVARDTGGACAGATVIEPAGGQVTGTTVGGTTAMGASCTGALASERVFSYTPPGTESGDLTLTVASDGDHGIYIRTDCQVATTETACVDFEPAGVPEVLKVRVAGGVPLSIIVDGYLPGIEAPFTLDASYAPATCGDGIVGGLEECEPPSTYACGDDCSLPDREYDCANLIDEDADVLIDCLDPDCQATPQCTPGTGLTASPCTAHTDCVASRNDPFCYSEGTFGAAGGACTEWCDAVTDPCVDPDAICLDVQGIGKICAKSCTAGTSCRAGQQCDAHGGTDLTCVPECTSGADCVLTGYCNAEANCSYPEDCTDAVDNDGDFATDCLDFDCLGADGCAPLNEVEPNNTPETAVPFVAPWHGAVSEIVDEDFASIQVTVPGSTIVARVGDPFDTGSCTAEPVRDGVLVAGKPIDSVVTIYAPDGLTKLAENDDLSPINLCSRTAARGLAPGLYYVRVFHPALIGTVFMYRLDVDVHAP